tara:strand:- start:1038 stop:1544 length:507 start_codon:yes stop_codon:yes gene_type:complete
MTSWSFLYDAMSEQQNEVTTLSGNISEATEKDYNDFWAQETISLTGVEDISYVSGRLGEDHISLNLDMTSNNPTRFKYSEERILKELTDYISDTYSAHYSAGDDKIQTLDLIEACGDGESFCRSNILKYASRYDKKGTARRDIMKILHYAVLLMHFNDKNAQRETYPQ